MTETKKGKALPGAKKKKKKSNTRTTLSFSMMSLHIDKFLLNVVSGTSVITMTKEMKVKKSKQDAYGVIKGYSPLSLKKRYGHTHIRHTCTC